jgi:hypothetical protein
MAVSEPWGMQGSELPKSSNLMLKHDAPRPVPGEDKKEENPDHYIRSFPETTYVLPEDPDPVKAVNRMIKAASAFSGNEKKDDPKDFGMLPFDLWFKDHTNVKAKKKKGMATRMAEYFGNEGDGTAREAPARAETQGDLDRSRTQLEGKLSSLASSSELVAPEVSDAPAATEIQFAGFSYKLNPEKKSWKEHEEEAKTWGGHLVSIHSKEEHDHVVKLLKESGVESGPCGNKIGEPIGEGNPPPPQCWIGAKRKEPVPVGTSGIGPGPDYWEWTDASPWDFTYWAGSQMAALDGSTDWNRPIEKDPEWDWRGEPDYVQIAVFNNLGDDFLWNNIGNNHSECIGIYKKGPK